MKPLLFAISTVLIFLIQCTNKKSDSSTQSSAEDAHAEMKTQEAEKAKGTTSLEQNTTSESGDSDFTTSEGPDSTTLDSTAKVKEMKNTQPTPTDNLMDKKEELQQKVIKEAPKPGQMNDELQRIKEEKNKVKK